MHSELSIEELARDWSLNFTDLDFLSTKAVGQFDLKLVVFKS